MYLTDRLTFLVVQDYVCDENFLNSFTDDSFISTCDATMSDFAVFILDCAVTFVVCGWIVVLTYKRKENTSVISLISTSTIP